MKTDEQQIRELVATWMDATRYGDTNTVLGLMADDARFLVAGHPPFGKEAFEATMRDQESSSVEFDGESEILELNVIGNWAFMLARLSVTTRQAGARDKVRAGNTLTILKKQDGKWLLYRDANLLAPVEASAVGDDGQ